MTGPLPRPAARLWRDIARAQDLAIGRRDPRDVVRAQDLLAMSRRESGSPPASRRWLPAGAALAVGLAAAAGFVVFRPSPAPEPALRFEVGAAPTAGTTGAPLAAGPHAPLPVRFSDGSSVRFAAGAAGRVERLGQGGAEVRLDRGRIDVEVEHAERTRWAFLAGPFVIEVTGTRFAADWAPDRGALSVALAEGGVIVRGGLLGAGAHLRAGQTLRLALGEGAAVIEPLHGPPGVTAGERARTSPPQTLVAVAEAAPATVAGTSVAVPTDVGAAAASGNPLESGDIETGRAAPANWIAHADRGAYAAAVAAAERSGFARLCRQLGPDLLLRLGDAARYAGSAARARQAFECLVDRFPRDARAADAVFSLGRLEFETRSTRAAAAWFERYLATWPRGPLVEPALGRLVESHAQGGDLDAACRAAARYLARHPDGAHARLARDACPRPDRRSGP